MKYQRRRLAFRTCRDLSEKPEVRDLIQDQAADSGDITRGSLIGGVDKDAPTGVSVVSELAAGPTAETYDFSEPCFSFD